MYTTRVTRLCIQRAGRGPFLSNTWMTPVLIRQPRVNVLHTRSYATEPEQVEVQAETPSAYPTRTTDERPKIYDGIAQEPFPAEVASTLMAPIDPKDVEIKPDGMIYLPEIRYRRILNRAFGPGAWALLPISPPIVERTNLIRTYALYCHGRFVSEATGEQPFFEGVTSTATAAEAAKSNALVRCCKDLGIGSELWDPQYIFSWKKKHSVEVQCENMKSKDRRRLWRRADRPPFEWPWKEIRTFTVMSQPKMPLETGVDPLGLQLAIEESTAPVSEAEDFSQQASQASAPPQRAQQTYQDNQQPQYQKQMQQPVVPHAQRPLTPPPSQAAPPAAATPPATPPPASATTDKKGKRGAAPAPAAVPAAAPAPAAAAPATAAPISNATWDLESTVHPQYKSYRTKKWREMLDPKGIKYLQWAAGNFQGAPQQDAIGFLAFVEAHGGAEAVRQTFAA